MNIRQLQFFCRAAETGSFSAAAQIESVTVQAVSKAVLELEQEIGEKLFQRTRKGIRLTPAGERLLAPAREAVASFDTVRRAASDLHREPEAPSGLRLSLVSPPFAKHEMICSIISRLISASTGVDARLDISLGAEALAALESGKLDALFTIGRLDAPGVTCTKVGTVSVGVFLGNKHPLRHKKTLSFSDLEPYPVLYAKAIDDFNQSILRHCQARGLRSPLREISTNEEVMEFLEHEEGFIAGVYLKALSIRPFAIMHEIDPADAPPVPICMILREGQRREEVAKLDKLVRSEFFLMKNVIDSEGSVEGY